MSTTDDGAARTADERVDPLTGAVVLERRGAVGVLTLDRPARLNAFTLEMVRSLDRLCEELASDDSVRSVVITGAGERAFSAGGDLESLLPATVGRGIDTVSPDPSRRFFSDFHKPVVAAVRGVCIGGGLEIMLGTDLRIASDDARFGLGEVKWGLIAGAGSHIRLPRQIPHAIAMQMLLTGEPISAVRAYEVGLVNEVVPGDKVLDRACEIAAAIARNAPVAVQTAKEAVLGGLGLTPGFVLEHALNTRVLRSDDATEGPRAFVEKRDPRFVGR